MNNLTAQSSSRVDHTFKKIIFHRMNLINRIRLLQKYYSSQNINNQSLYLDLFQKTDALSQLFVIQHISQAVQFLFDFCNLD